MNTYTSPLHLKDLPDDILCTVFADKRQVGGEPDSGVPMPLSVMLTEKFPQDHHFLCYTTPNNMRLRKDMKSEPMRFDFCAFDLDYDDHKSLPTIRDFEQIVFSCYVISFGGVSLPNIIYQTRGGCRLVYLIRPLSDADLFEAHIKALGKKISVINNGLHKYKFDTQPLDWTRFFRCPLVVRDEKEEYENHVRLYHTELLDLLRFKAAPKKEYTSRPPRPLSSNIEFDRLLIELQVKLTPGCRNSEWHKWAYKVWIRHGEDAEGLYEPGRDLCLVAGLDEREVQTAWQSAKKAANNKENGLNQI